jgi:cystathionine beta-lyase/cystathionine gamma-synthase
MLRGLRTLSVRLARHQESAMSLAEMLEENEKVARVFYTGLPSHPQADLARRQMRGHTGMLSFVLHDGTREAAHRLVDALEYFCIAVSWGGYESLAIPLEVVDPGTGEKTWIIRLSVGLESADDLRTDLRQALDRV